MKVKVRLFAFYREALGREEIDVELPAGATVAHVFDGLFGGPIAERLPRKTTMYAVNQTYQPPDTPLRDGDEVAFIPPVAGGAR